jgi:hypothetical protein
MSSKSANELGGFHQFVSEKMHKGESSLSPEQVLDEWRVLHPDPSAAQDDIAAIQEAIDDMEKGDGGIPFKDFDRDFRSRRNLPAPS